jgi:hypothetical protein
MKIITLILISLFVSSCNKEKENIKTQADTINDAYDANVKYLKDWEEEKITLFSIISGIDKNKVITVIAEYETKRSYSSDYDDIEKIIDTISFTQLIPKKEVAKIIFGYKYEMITKDDFVEDLEQEYNSEQIEEGNAQITRGY